MRFRWGFRSSRKLLAALLILTLSSMLLTRSFNMTSHMVWNENVNSFSNNVCDPALMDKQDEDLTGLFLDSDSDARKTLKNALERVASKSRTVLLMMTDKSVEQMAFNFYWKSLRPHNITNYLYLSRDPSHCQALQSRNISCFSVANRTDGRGLLYRSRAFIRLMNLRLEILLASSQMGFNILISDIDMIYKKNPFEHIKSDTNKDYDLYYLADTGVVINAGFMLVKAKQEVVTNLRFALHIVRSKPLIDDQQAINCAFQILRDGNIYRLPIEEFSSGNYHWENGYTREFRDEMKPCERCVVIHNNWIVSVEAKVYRMRESGMWIMDYDAYYSDHNRKYITYENPLVFPKDKDAKIAEWSALRSALAFAQILNRTLILPKFRCGADISERANQNCSFLHRTKVRLFEENFPNYREHSFLLHELVPASTKTSTSPWVCLDVENKHMTKDVMNNYKSCETVVAVASRDKGMTSREVLTNFQNSTYKILRFRHMYGTFSSFDNKFEHSAFEDKVNNSLISCEYRQF